MKKILHLLILLLATDFLQAQNVGIGTVTPQAKVHIVPDNAAGILISAYGVGAGQTGELRFSGITGTGYVALKAPDNTPAPLSFTLPSSSGTNGQVLSTNGTGNLSWVNMTQSNPSGGDCCLPTMFSAESPGYMNLGQMMIYCDTLTEGGFTDWKLPTFNQLLQGASGVATLPGPRSSNALRTTTPSPTNGSYYLCLMLSDGYMQNYTGSQTSWGITCRCAR